MKFGAVPEHLLTSINFSLPPDAADNKVVLPGYRAKNPKVYVGAATWGNASWAGTLYPLKTPATKFRSLYPQQFNAVELNATHYNIYPPGVIRQWAAPARGKDFKFCPKFPQAISHYSGFKNAEVLTNAFLESIWAFEEVLGPVFLQLGENYSPQNKQALFEYLAALPQNISFFLEVRHPQWMADAKEKEELFKTLMALNIGAVITDTPGRRNLVHMHLTIPKTILRFVCHALHPTTFSRASEWIKRWQYWIDNGLNEAYIFLHPGNDAAIPTLATYWVTELNRQCGLQLTPPRVQQQQLF